VDGAVGLVNGPETSVDDIDTDVKVADDVKAELDVEYVAPVVAVSCACVAVMGGVMVAAVVTEGAMVLAEKVEGAFRIGAIENQTSSTYTFSSSSKIVFQSVVSARNAIKLFCKI